MLTQAHADFFTEEQRMVRDMARDYSRAGLAPNAARWDEEGYVPDATIAKMGELGLMGMFVRGMGAPAPDYLAYALSIARSRQAALRPRC